MQEGFDYFPNRGRYADFFILAVSTLSLNHAG